jgi:hypothetical protein
MINENDTNYDGVVNPEDNLSTEELEMIRANCDFDFDGNVDMCEIHLCVLASENEFRDLYCHGYGSVVCECPFYVEPKCG